MRAHPPRSAAHRPTVTAAVAALLAIATIGGGIASAGTPPRLDLVPWAQLDDQWGPWLPERLWGTPRESVGLDGWALDWETAITTDYVTFDDGIAGWTDRDGSYRLGWAFWDGREAHVTERFAGDTNPDGVAGETITDDRVFDETSPTASYAAMRVRYPAETGTFRIELDTARADDTTIVFRARVRNGSDEPATLHLLFKGWLAPDGEVTGGRGTLELSPAPDERLLVRSPDLREWQVSDVKGALDAEVRAGGLTNGGEGHIGVLGTVLELAPGEQRSVLVWAHESTPGASGQPAPPRRELLAILARRERELRGLYRDEVAAHEDLYRDALMDLLWSRSLYRWDGTTGLDTRLAGTVDANDVLIMPDKWEYPWLASWDAAFHAVTAAIVDPQLGATELRFLLSPSWQTPDGHVPCGEWVMLNECPPLFAWAALRIADADPIVGEALLGELYPALGRHYAFWWDRLQVKDSRLFRGGFMGLDNLPGRAVRPQADASGWMAMFARDMAEIARRAGDEGASAAYEAQRDEIAAAVNASLWDETEGWYLDVADGSGRLLPVPSVSGLVPLIAGIVPPDRLERMLARLKDETDFLSPGGIRSLSARSDLYVPGEAGRGVNSNWRGPVWMPINLLAIEALEGIDPAFARQVRERVVGNVEAQWRATERLWEFYDGDTGAGLGADAQTGWTAAVAVLIAEGWPR